MAAKTAYWVLANGAMLIYAPCSFMVLELYYELQATKRIHVVVGYKAYVAGAIRILRLSPWLTKMRG